MVNYLTFAQAQQGGVLGMLATFAPLIIIFAVMYFLMIRPQKKREKELQAKIQAMREGDNVMTIGGVVGRIMNITNDEVTIATSVANTLITFKKNAISSVQSAYAATDAADAKKVEEKASGEEKEEKKKKWFGKESDVE